MVLTFCRGCRKSFTPVMAFAITLLATLSLVPAAMAQGSDTVTVDVTVSSVNEITVTPATLSFSAPPGVADVDSVLDIENSGSNNISRIHLYVDTLISESVRPYGSTQASDFGAGAVITVQNETLDDMFFAGRVEWNETEDIANMVKTGVQSPVSWGFFRNLSSEYNWLIGNGTAGVGGSEIYCNNTAMEFAIENDVDTGTASTRTPEVTNITAEASDGNWTYFRVDNRVPLFDSCVAVYWDCSKAYMYKYDKRSELTSDSGDFQQCTNSEYIQYNNLVPGSIHKINVTAFVPNGIPSGSLNTSVMTISGSAGL